MGIEGPSDIRGGFAQEVDDQHHAPVPITKVVGVLGLAAALRIQDAWIRFKEQIPQHKEI